MRWPLRIGTARRIGIGLALIMRLALLGTVAIIVTLTTPVIHLFGHGFSWRDIILIAGGLFLVWKATKEIHHNVDPATGDDMFDAPSAARIGFSAAIGYLGMSLAVRANLRVAAAAETQGRDPAMTIGLRPTRSDSAPQNT